MRRIQGPGLHRAVLFRHGGRPEREDRDGILDFSINVNPLGPPAAVLDRLRQALPNIARYPDPRGRALTNRLAALHDVPPGQVCLGNGSNDLIYAVGRAFPQRHTSIVEPTYTEYLRASLLVGSTVTHWLADEDFRLEPFDLEGAGLVWLGNPNNPTGHLWPAETLHSWIEAHPRTIFVVDEAFLPFLAAEAEHSLIRATTRLPNLIVLRSLTKIYAFPGLRLGYAVASTELAARLREQIVPWSINVLAQEAGLAALDDGDYLRRTRAWLQTEGKAFTAALAEFAEFLEPIPSRANFVLARLRNLTAARLTAGLADCGIFVRDASNFIGLDDRYIRLAIRPSADNRRLLHELRACLKEP
jgi:threonine-phosphate decarboxylase